MKIGIPTETVSGETRVAMVPAMVSAFTRLEHEVIIQKDAGLGSFISDAEFEESGASIVGDAQMLFSGADIIFKVQPPSVEEVNMMKDGAIYMGYLAPLANHDVLKAMNEKKITSFATEFIPRISRAQSMDTLSSMATLAGYKAVLIAANHLNKIFPLLMTAAGSIPPANTFVLGAGVAGLQAIATAKRLGSRVEAFDPRPAVEEQVKSLGAKFVAMEVPEENVETSGGYAKAQSDAFLLAEQKAIGDRLAKVDVIITTAAIFGKKAPILITEEMVKKMRPGSVIIDLAIEGGGNCELTEAGKTVVKHDVTIVGTINLPATLSINGSSMFSKNLLNLFKNLFQSEDNSLDFEEEVTAGACITHDGKVQNDLVANSMTGGNA
ncbi:MAG: Re/Si-specific NAD(P)(+) transhydrogenase subunit alpha [Candidatus Marinimicrobia bacterium]|nr:Re/Si-specific NAD(P)(+) transhydrogenase subunit alpha [Candidatus Neomarinimicrobiota bacterium]MCF7904715.1 Re/Si-specific NAD(P)(+) transhydrogenase subunit alpha [Candidatus Neomarinimicrobiota bacterium]